ncbi:MAG TPA: AMP-binding protein [Caulobacteraceae bacterium]|jgi:crotonobetaine/carnitine-CoA ligase|nr:AMP-binding protein [Caulobacteraceae bacterium]
MTKAIETTLPTLLRQRAVETPDRLYAVDIDDRRLSYAETAALMDRWGAAFGRVGVGRGDIVATMQLNTIEAMAGWLGLVSIGAVEAPLNTDYRGALLSHALNTTEATTMVLDAQYLDRVIEVAAELPHLKRLILLNLEQPAANLPFECVPAAAFLGSDAPEPGRFEASPWDIAAILFTSGTTGPSKAVQLPWRQIYATTVATLPIDDLGPEDVIFNAGPTYHVGAKVFPFLAALIGGRHVIRPFISESRMPDEYRKFGVTTCFYPPLSWLDEPPRPDDADCALRNLLLPLAVPRMAEFKARFGCRTYSLYNMTELSCPIADPDWDVGRVNAEGLFSCGVVRPGFPGYEARLVDEWDQPVPPGVVGELVVRTSEPWAINAGYLNNPKETAAAWRNGWFHTGDAFSRDEEGYFYFRDRIKDCIRRRAENISSFEVEAGVRRHPEVADCAAVAQKQTNQAAADEEIRLIVVRAPGSALDAESLVRWLIPRTPRFMIPRYVEFIDALPRTPTLKVQKAQLRNRPLQGVWDREQAGIELPR